MDNKADVKAIMARFQAGGTNGTEEPPSLPAQCSKPALHPTLSSGPPVPTKKPISESFSGSAIPIPPKPKKMTISTKSAPEVREFPKTRDTNGNNKPLIANKQQFPFRPLSQDAEAKIPMPKLPLHKPSLSSTLPDSKPAFTKPSPGVPSSKPSWGKEESGSAPSPRILPLQHKPSSAMSKLRLQNEDEGGANKDSNKSSHTSNSTLQHSNFRNAQNLFNKETEQSDSGSKGEGAKKLPLVASTSTHPPRPPASKKPSFVRKPSGPSSHINSISGDGTFPPKRNPLPNNLALGLAPAKPNRPPRVSLEAFRQAAEALSDGPGTLKKTTVPPPLAAHHSIHSNHIPPTPPNLNLPCLPPRHPAAIQPDPDENYDDVGLMTSPPPPPLPPSAGHPSQRAKSQEDDEDDGEMYEDLDERWDAVDIKEQEKKREKEDKEEKKRLEAEKKEQKERDKKEQDARKKFKLVGPLEMIHKVKARVDSRGSKTDLALKQGDWVDIIRINGNPEGKWLGRTEDGSLGYVKTTSVDIDLECFKEGQGAPPPTQPDYDPEVYDDIDLLPPDNFNSGIKGPGVVLPPPPDEDGEIYDDVVDPNLDVRVPPPSQFTAEGNPGAAIDDEIYDDVDSQAFPPILPPVSSIPSMKAKNRTDEIDPKKQKKFEKEEKDFRKKFKYDGEIQVLYQVTIMSTLTNKKWSGKELPIKPGETLDVIVKPMDNKLICRNEEGKFGYVLNSYITEDADIYDDIGDDCIYDND